MAASMTTVVRSSNQAAQRNWTTGLMDCSDDIGICLMGFFCPCSLLCENAAKLDENACCLTCFIPWPYGQLLLRTKLRAQQNIKGSICDDWFTVSLCTTCAMCQEAREIKAIALGAGQTVTSTTTTTVVTQQPGFDVARPVAAQPPYNPACDRAADHHQTLTPSAPPPQYPGYTDCQQ